MFFSNYISRNDTDRFVPMFEIIYGFEILLIAITFLVGLSVDYLAYNATKLHRLVRLRIQFSVLVALLHYASRLVVMYHQYFGPSQYVETRSLIIVSMMKHFFMGYIITLTSIVSLDRWVATKSWAWYERSANSTLLFYALQESIIFVISFTIAYLLVYDHITSMTTVFCFGGLVAFGAITFVLVFRHNIKVMQQLNRGAEIHRYSVSQKYQIKDNIFILTAYFKISKPLVVVCLPPLVLYPTFYLVPPNIGFDGLRFFCAAVFDLWLPIGAITLICCIPRYFPQLKQPLKHKSKRSSIVSLASVDKFVHKKLRWWKRLQLQKHK